MESDSLACCMRMILQHTNVNSSYVIAKNEFSLIDFKNLPIFVISNTMNRDSPGEHWFCVNFYRSRGELVAEAFDSYGNDIVEKYNVKLPCRIVRQSSITAQSNNSLLCGVYCLVYIYYKSRHRSLRAIESRFTNNLERNDDMVRRFYRRFKLLKRKSSALLSCCTRKMNKL